MHNKLYKHIKAYLSCYFCHLYPWSQSGMIEFIDVFDKENDELKRGHAHANGKHAGTFKLLT